MRTQNYRAVLMIALGLFTALSSVEAAVRLPGFFSDHMVLQREMALPIWGWGDAGETVEVSLAGNSKTTKVGADGKWRVELPALKAGGPHVLTVVGKNTLTLKDILIGEVWLCSGQSNMEWTVARSSNPKEEAAAANYPQIRHMKVAHRPSLVPLDDVSSKWEICSPATVSNFTACGYFMARELHKSLNVPIGLVNSSWGGTRVEPWTAPIGFAEVPALKSIHDKISTRPTTAPKGKRLNHQEPVMLYNGMIHALVGFPIRGAIWYQGESNHNEGMLYTEKKRALIGSWRKLWDIGDFPFNFVQIAPFQYGNEDPKILANFWEAQSAVLEIPNTAQIVINDVATLKDIHPPNKQAVGKRLAAVALNRTYGKPMVDSGPIFKEMKVEKGRLRVSFTHAEGLTSRDGKPLTYFEVAGQGTGYLPANATIDGNSVVLSSPQVPQPMAMRFAWHKLAEPNLVNAAGWPTSAFRAGEIPVVDNLDKIADASGYKLAYDLDLERLGPTIAYNTDNSAQLTGAIDRIAYLLELEGAGKPSYLWVSMDAFTPDAKKIGVPVAASGPLFQQAVTNMVVESNVAGISTGKGIAGNIEFWPSNYAPANTANVAGANTAIYDFGDSHSGNVVGYGSMQVHATDAKQTLLAVNNFRAGGSGADIGIGNSPKHAKGAKDWTFFGNGGSYHNKRLRIFVKLK